MIWRQAYETQIRSDLEALKVPCLDLDGREVSLTDGAIIGGHIEQWTEIEAWRKLIAEHRPTLLIHGVDPTQRELVDLIVPGSLRPSVVLGHELPEWAGGRAYAAVQRQGSWPIVMIGPATEDALERMLSEL